MANTVNDNFNVYQKTNNEIIEKGIDTTNKYQQETINTIQSISNNNPIELQKIFLILSISILKIFK
jgi:acetamidase/formamidase